MLLVCFMCNYSWCLGTQKLWGKGKQTQVCLMFIQIINLNFYFLIYFLILKLRLLDSMFADVVLGSSVFPAEISWSLAAELPPPYTAIASPDASGVPVINCRVCQSLINLDGKLHQHVVKCTVCNEATVKWSFRVFFLWRKVGGKLK